MYNELIWFASILVNFFLIILGYKLFGKWGLIAWIPVSVIVANIEVVQTVTLFGMASTLGNVIYATSFLITDILSENHGKQEAKRAVWIGFFSLISMTLLMNIALLFHPIPGDEFSGSIHGSLKSIFSLMPRIAGASLIAYLLSQTHDVWAFHFWRDRFPKDHHLWIANNFSTMVSQVIDSAVFVLVAFWGTFETKVLVEIFITTYVLKFLVAAADTPFVYWARVIHRKGRYWVK